MENIFVIITQPLKNFLTSNRYCIFMTLSCYIRVILCYEFFLFKEINPTSFFNILKYINFILFILSFFCYNPTAANFYYMFIYNLHYIYGVYVNRIYFTPTVQITVSDQKRRRRQLLLLPAKSGRSYHQCHH